MSNPTARAETETEHTSRRVEKAFWDAIEQQAEWGPNIDLDHLLTAVLLAIPSGEADS